jgi:DNA-binding beta-propeller fold protein YncE
LSNGEVYVCQSRNRNNPRPRITILNGAFFPEREIFLDEIPEAADFVPSQLAISHDGIIYLASASSRGVLVLDSDGNFLRRLEPMDKVSTLISDEEAEEEESSAEDEAFLANIPEEFRPMKSRKVGTSRFREGTGPVKINNVTIDSTGKIYLMSLETSRIYVYGPDEAFLFAFGEKGGTPRHLSQPKSMAIDEKRGLIYVADYMRHSILTYDLAGTYLFEFGGRGDGPGWFNYPNGLAINSQGQLIVADLFNKRVQVLEVGYEAMLTELGLGPPAGAPAAGSGEGEATGQGDFAPEQPGSIAEQVKMPEEGNGAAQDESAAGPPEEVGGEDKALPQPLEPGEPGLNFPEDRPEPSE